MAYGAFALHEFVGPDIFRALLMSSPSNWPLHAWFYLPMIPFSLIISCMPLVIWTISPLILLLFLWPSTFPISTHGGSSRSARFSLFASCQSLWPPPTVLVCALFPIVCILYGHLHDHIVRRMVQDIVLTRSGCNLRMAL